MEFSITVLSVYYKPTSLYKNVRENQDVFKKIPESIFQDSGTDERLLVVHVMLISASSSNDHLSESRENQISRQNDACDGSNQ